MFEKLLSFFGLAQKKKDSASDQETPEDIREKRVENRLNQLMRTRLAGSSTAVGQLMVLNLDAARIRIGTKWPLVSRHVHMLVENILSQRLGHSNIYFRCEEGLYAIVFSDRSREEAEAKCRALSIEIMSRLFGDVAAGFDDADMPGVSLSVHGQSCDIELDTLPHDLPFVDSLKALVIEQSHEVKKGALIPSSFISVLERTEEKLARLIPEARRTRSPVLLRRMKTLLQQLRELERGLSLMRPAGIEHTDYSSMQNGISSGVREKLPQEWTAIQVHQDPFLRLAVILERVEAEIETLKNGMNGAAETIHRQEISQAPEKHAPIAAAAEDIEWQTFQDHDIKFTVDYVPLIDLSTGIKGINLGRIRFLMNERIVDPETLAREEAELEVRLIADRLLLRELVNDRKAQEGANPLTMLPLDQATIDNISARRHYLQIASQFSEERRRAVIFELQLHSGWQPTKVAMWLSDLQPYCRAIFIRLPLDAIPAISELRQLGAWSVKQTSIIGIAMPFGTTFSVHSHAVVETLKRLADALSLRCYVLGVNRARDVEFCRQRGIRYVTYEAALPPRKGHDAIERIDVATLLSQAQKRELNQRQR